MAVLPVDAPADILLVDDNPANLRLLSQILAERGHRVRAVTSGPRALASARMHAPDLVLLDIRMPDMDGYQVCRQLKAEPATTDVPILFISALDDIHDKVEAFSAGGQDYITKPFQVEEVVARVETHLSLRRLQRRLLEANRRMERELVLAAQVQASFLPAQLPEVPGWQLAVSLLPAKHTSGDFYDAALLPDGRVGILIADVVDKGAGAALYMAMSSTLLRAAFATYPDQPERVCQEVNERLLEYAGAGQFVTVFCGLLDPATGELTYANAGHHPPLLIGPEPADEVRSLRRTGLPLGVLDDAEWEAGQVHLGPGAALVLYTDGMTDVLNPAGDHYRIRRLVGAATALRRAPAVEIRDSLLAAAHAWADGQPFTDDIALLVLARDCAGSDDTQSGPIHGGPSLLGERWTKA
jgi:phosphoserine phosphatase RsbU/P